MDTINIHRKVKDEYVPRRATVSGGTFADMLAFVKGLEGARYEGGGISKSWQVRGAASVAAITAQGYTLTPWSVLRVAVDTSVSTALDRVDTDRDMQSIAVHLEQMMPHGTYTSDSYIHIALIATPEARAIAHAHVQQRVAALGVDLGTTRYSGWQTIVRMVLTTIDTTLQARFNASFLPSTRDAKALDAALEVVRAVDDDPDDPIRRWAVVVDGDTTAICDARDPRTVALFAAHAAAQERAHAAAQAEAVARRADRLARAPELMREWLLQDAKADLIALAQRRAIPVKKSATKTEIVACLVADHDWCRRNIDSSVAKNMGA